MLVLLERLDDNADGRLSAAEAGEQHRLLFERMVRTGDDDGDGLLNVAELTAALTPLRRERPPVVKQGSRLPGADDSGMLLPLDSGLQLESFAEELCIEPVGPGRGGLLDSIAGVEDPERVAAVRWYLSLISDARSQGWDADEAEPSAQEEATEEP